MIYKNCYREKYAKCPLLVMCLFILASCDTSYTVWSHQTVFSVFRFQEPSYKEYVLVDSVKDKITGQYSLQVHGTARRGVKQFFISDDQSVNAFNDPISRCEIADEGILYYPLHDGYYMCFPLNGLVLGHYLTSCRWSELCEANMDTVRVVLPATEVFSNIHKILGTSVGNYCNKKVDRISLEDVVRYANMLIDQYKDHPSDWYESPEIREKQ